MNAWYAIGWDTDIGRSLKPFTVCGLQMLAYRRFDRNVAVIADACWHRGLPLSLGRLVGDEVECAYHGLRFTAEGGCTFVPGQDVVPASACVRAFPVVEYYHFGFARNFRLDSRELDEEIKNGVTRIFGEDKVILEAQQRAFDLNSDLRLRDLKIDSGSVRVRRLIDRWLQLECEAPVASGGGPSTKMEDTYA